MYESTFQLEKRPFVAVPSAEFYFPAESIETARVSLVRLVERDEGPAMVVGPVGIGKSMLSQLLAQTFRSRLRIALIPSARICTRRTLLQVILHQFGLPYQGLEEGELRLSLIDHVTSKDFCPNGALMLVDEADALPMLLIDELRTMTNIISAGESCVRLILFGSSRLEEKMAHPRLESLNQRLAGRFYIEPFDLEETIDYVTAHFEQCGGVPEEVFSEDALHTVYSATNGVPRLVNQLCDHALILAAIDGKMSISRDLVNEAWADLQQLPTPTFNRSASPTNESDFIEFGELDCESDTLEDSVTSRLDDIEDTVDELHDEYEYQDDEEEDDDRPTLRVHCDPVDDEESELEETDDLEPQIQLAENPFEEDFDEEIIVVDRFRSADLLARRNERTVACERSEVLANQLTALIPAEKPSSSIDGPCDNVKENDPQSADESPGVTADELESIAEAQRLESDPTVSEEPELNTISTEQEIMQQLEPIEMTDGYSIIDDVEYSSEGSDSSLQAADELAGDFEDVPYDSDEIMERAEDHSLRTSEELSEGILDAEPVSHEPSDVADDGHASPSVFELPFAEGDSSPTEPIAAEAAPAYDEADGGSEEIAELDEIAAAESDVEIGFENEIAIEQEVDFEHSPNVVTNIDDVGYECRVEYQPIVVSVEQPIFVEPISEALPEEVEDDQRPVSRTKETLETKNSEERFADTDLAQSCSTATLVNSEPGESAKEPEKSPNQKFRRLFLKLKQAT